MHIEQKRRSRLCAIHDLSGLGRCSLNVIIPVLSAFSVQTCAVPTAVLSTHTGFSGEPVIRDLGDFLLPALAHFKRLHTDFDCLYTGFFSDAAQAEHALAFFENYPQAFHVVDPVMGNHGRFYKTCSPALREKVGALVRRADLITPNLTECAALLGGKYSDGPLLREQVKGLMLKLSQLGPEKIVLTGVPLSTGQMVNCGYEKTGSSFWVVKYQTVPANYPGTGDLFSATLVGGLLHGDSLPMAMARATRFVELATKITYGYQTPPQDGVLLEEALPWLFEQHVPDQYEIF